jgi:type IV pilus assembly protein PilO
MAITFDDIKKLSPQAKALIVIGVICLVGYFYYVYFLSDVLAKKERLETEYQDMLVQIKQKEKIAADYDKYKADVETLEENYKVALLKLPDQREIPGLFHSVALAGAEAGVEFLLFEPKAAVPKTLDPSVAEAAKISDTMKPTDRRGAARKAADKKQGAKAEPEPEPFYEEIPVKVTVLGTFQNIVHLFEKVSKLPRIVNVSGIVMGDRKEIKGRGYLITASCMVKTYMFIDKEKTSEKQNEKK